MTKTNLIGAPANAKNHKAEIKKLLAELTRKVNAYGKGDAINWGHVGSLAYVKNELETVNEFLK